MCGTQAPPRVTSGRALETRGSSLNSGFSVRLRSLAVIPATCCFVSAFYFPTTCTSSSATECRCLEAKGSVPGPLPPDSFTDSPRVPAPSVSRTRALFVCSKHCQALSWGLGIPAPDERDSVPLPMELMFNPLLKPVGLGQPLTYSSVRLPHCYPGRSCQPGPPLPSAHLCHRDRYLGPPVLGKCWTRAWMPCHRAGGIGGLFISLVSTLRFMLPRTKICFS